MTAPRPQFDKDLAVTQPTIVVAKDGSLWLINPINATCTPVFYTPPANPANRYA